MAADELVSTRVDKWLWSIRVFKTRTLATEAVKAGHVAVNRSVTKASSTVRVGDVVTVRLDGRDRVLEVARVIDKRVGAPVAAACVVDLSPPPPPEAAAPVFRRDAHSGRPTKADRRRLDRIRQR
ncbi:MAG TPA: RNA-binding S4 domain-containing protein [Acidimicrobiales bacterium]|nr:RNA-binding S4 domain-containing protein [Acidimicrobiales bacterium]